VTPAADQEDRDFVSKLYQFAIDEYRFQVRLNWDRSRDYLVINLGLLTIATGLLRVDNGRAANGLVMLLFTVGSMTSWLAARAVVKGHEYYRRTIFKKTIIEEHLGLLRHVADFEHPLATFAIGTTAGMANVERILRDPDSWITQRPGRRRVWGLLVVVLRLLAVVNVCGSAAALLRIVRATPPVWNRLLHVFG
jgi:hypothetical protein